MRMFRMRFKRLRKSLGLFMVACATIDGAHAGSPTPCYVDYITAIDGKNIGTYDKAIFKSKPNAQISYKTVNDGSGRYNFSIDISGVGYYALRGPISITVGSGDVGKTVPTTVKRTAKTKNMPRYLYSEFNRTGSIIGQLPIGQVASGLDMAAATNGWDCGAKGFAYADEKGYVQCCHTDYIYTVTFVANGAAQTMPNAVFTNNAPWTVPTYAYARTGYNFLGWRDTTSVSAGTNVAVGAKFQPGANGTSPITLTARWTAKTSTVTLDNGTTKQTVKATYGLAMPAADVPVRTGYVFKGFYSGANGTGTQYYTSSGASVRTWDQESSAVTLYAYWVAKTCTLTFDASTEQVRATYGATLKSVTVPTQKGYVFVGYFTMIGGAGIQYYKADGTGARVWGEDTESGVTLYAHWQNIPVVVTLDRQNGIGGDDTIQVAYDESWPAIDVPLKNGCRFKGYFTEPNGQGKKFYLASGNPCWVKCDLTADTTLYAYWQVAIAFDPNGGTLAGAMCGQCVTNLYGEGTCLGTLPTVVSTNAQNEARIFAGWWQTNGVTTVVQVFSNDVVSADTTFVARWKEPNVVTKYTVAFDVQGIGMTPAAQFCAANAALGTLPMVSDVPADKYLFGWFADPTLDTPVSGDTLITNDCTFYAGWSERTFNDVFGSNILFHAEVERPWLPETNAVLQYVTGNVTNSTIRSAVMNKGESSILSISVYGAGDLNFAYRISGGEKNGYKYPGDQLCYPSATVSSSLGNGEVFWTGGSTRHFDNTGRHDLSWGYIKDNNDEDNGHYDRALLSCITWTPDSVESAIDAWAVKQPVMTVGGVFTTGGSASWQTNDTCSAIMSGSIGDNRSSWVRLTMPQRPGVMTFRWRVDCEPGYVDTNGVYQTCDTLTFYAGTNCVAMLDGSNGWATVTYTNTAVGVTTYEWRYTKDSDTTMGEDSAAITDVSWQALSVEPTISGAGGLALSADQLAIIKDNLATYLSGADAELVTRILVSGTTAKATTNLSAILHLGVRPQVIVGGEVAQCLFAEPELRVLTFDAAALAEGSACTFEMQVKPTGTGVIGAPFLVSPTLADYLTILHTSSLVSPYIAIGSEQIQVVPDADYATSGKVRFSATLPVSATSTRFIKVNVR